MSKDALVEFLKLTTNVEQKSEGTAMGDPPAPVT